MDEPETRKSIVVSRQAWTTALELKGLALVVIGVALLLSIPAALIVAGLGEILVGYLEGRQA